MSERKRKSAEAGNDRRRSDEFFGTALAVSLALNLTAATALSVVELPERVSSQAEAVPRTALVSYESDAPLPEAVIDRDADLLLSGSGEGPATGEEGSDGSEVERTSARSAEGGGGGAGEGSGEGGGDDAESAEQAFLSAFGDPSAEGTGGGGVVGDADVRNGGSSGSSAPRIGGPRSGIGEGGGSRSGRQPLSGGGSAVAGRLGPGEGEGEGGGGGIERTGSVAISSPGGSGEGEASGASAAVFERIGNRVRSYEAQIRFCYQEEGLKQNPDLAGTVRVEFDVSGGRVSSATLRSGLSGQGGEATERCILEAIREWRFVDVDESVTVPYTFVLSR